MQLDDGRPTLRRMDITRFSITMACACGRTTKVESVLKAEVGAAAPISCACGRGFKLEQVEVLLRLAVDPCGVTGGAVPSEVELPEVH